MPSLFDAQRRDEVLERIGRLAPDRKPLWGRFTAPEMVCHVSCGLRQSLDVSQLRALVGRFADRGPAGAWPASRVFGRISGRSWGVLQYKHLDHHLRQFGA